MARILPNPLFSELLQKLELEVDVVDDVLASHALDAVSRTGRNTSTKLLSILGCIVIGYDQFSERCVRMQEEIIFDSTVLTLSHF